jgi:hypothetical protein
VRRVPQRAADVGDALDEAVVSDEGIGPDSGDDLVLGDDLARACGQSGEHLGRLAAQGDRLTIKGLKFFAFCREEMTAKRNSFGRFRSDFGFHS